MLGRPTAVVVLSLACASPLQGLLAAAAPLPPGWHAEQVFDTYSPLAAKREFARRVFTPTTVERLQRFERASGVTAVEHTVNLAQERFDLYVPATRPAAGYGLIVFVSPTPAFSPSRDWKREFDARGLVFVTARRSGNEQNLYERRMPLALHAYANVAARLPIDPARVYVAGFSGGSRVAQRLALAHSDVFRGVLLFASSDPFGVPGVLGEPPLSPPTAEFMRPFQERTRVVFVTGRADLPNRVRDERTRASLRAYCVSNIADINVPRLGHWVPDRPHITHALAALEAPPADDPDREACRIGLQRSVDAALDRVAALLAEGRAKEAGIALGEAEDRYGGLAAPRSVELAVAIAAALQGR